MSPTLVLADAATIITAIGAAIAAVLGGAATVIAALNRRTARETERKMETGNGAMLGRTVSKLQADMAEQRPLLEWARLRRASELSGIPRPSPQQVSDAETELHRSIDDEAT